MPALGESGQTPERRAQEAGELLTKLIDAAGAMSDREREFVEKLYERYEQYQEQTYVSPKQLFWLRDLLEKYL